jgi:hypothetical protein
MSYHSFDPWRYEDGPDTFPTDEVVKALGYHGMRRPAAYALLSPTDMMIYAIGAILEKKPAQEWTDEEISGYLKFDDYAIAAMKPTFVVCIRKVLDKIVAQHSG